MFLWNSLAFSMIQWMFATWFIVYLENPQSVTMENTGDSAFLISASLSGLLDCQALTHYMEAPQPIHCGSYREHHVRSQNFYPFRVVASSSTTVVPVETMCRALTPIPILINGHYSCSMLSGVTRRQSSLGAKGGQAGNLGLYSHHAVINWYQPKPYKLGVRRS